MATAAVSSTPNPDALKFTLDVTLPAMLNLSSADQATTAFERQIMAVPGVANLFGVNDFVTITRVPGTEWEPIIDAVHQAVKELL